MARNALFSAGFSASAAPVPVMRPGSGVIARATGCESKPTPEALSNAAASVRVSMLYGAGRARGSSDDPSMRIFARTSAEMGAVTVTVRTPICIGSVQPAASYGVSSGPPGDSRISGYFCASSTSRTSAANS
jgi:hypothetical protein